MARPKKNLTPEESAAIIEAHKFTANNSAQIGPEEVKALADKIDYIEKPKQKVVVTKFQMGLPCDLLGSKFSFSASRNMSMEATPLGIIMRSAGTKRKIMVPWANIKAAEFAWDGE